VKTLALTPTCNTTWSSQTETEMLTNRGVLWQASNYSLFQSGAGSFSFGIFGPVGAIQSKEVTIDKEGSKLHCSKIAFQFLFQKEKIS
jgi:hypothetical protein